MQDYELVAGSPVGSPAQIAMAGEPTEADRSAGITGDSGYCHPPSDGGSSGNETGRSKLGGLSGRQKIEISFQNVTGKIIG